MALFPFQSYRCRELKRFALVMFLIIVTNPWQKKEVFILFHNLGYSLSHREGLESELWSIWSCCIHSQEAGNGECLCSPCFCQSKQSSSWKDAPPIEGGSSYLSLIGKPPHSCVSGFVSKPCQVDSINHHTCSVCVCVCMWYVWCVCGVVCAVCVYVCGVCDMCGVYGGVCVYVICTCVPFLMEVKRGWQTPGPGLKATMSHLM